MELKKFLEESTTTRAELAKKVGITSYSLWRYTKYGRLPTSETMLAIWKATGGKVAPNDWFPQLKKGPPKPRAKRKPAKATRAKQAA